MNAPVIKDMQEMVDLIRARGYPGDSFLFDVPLHYAQLVHDELKSVGIHISCPQAGDEINLELQNRGNVTMRVH
jgi:hypothetical protein